MESIIFFTLSILAMVVVLYLGVTSVIKGFSAKNERTLDNQGEDQGETDNKGNILDNESSLSSEIEKLNDLHKSGALSKEEFEKAKAKLLEN